MSNIVRIIVQIEDVGTGDDATIGMTAGNIEWDTFLTSGGPNGLLDKNSIPDLEVSCNIAQGGTLGSFGTKRTITVYGQAILDAITNETISLIGKTVKIFLSIAEYGSTDSEQRYQGKISSSFVRDKISAVIECDARSAFNQKVIPSFTVTEEMALGVKDSSAIGQTITTTYGQVCDFPLVRLPVTSPYFAMLLEQEMPVDDGGGSILMYGTSFDSDPTTLDPLLNRDGDFVGLSSLQILGKYQEGGGNLWVCLSCNGTQLFTSEASSQIERIKKAFFGLTVKVIRGKGVGSFFKIMDLEYATRDAGEQTISSVWFKLNTSDLDALDSAGGFDSVFATNDTANHNLRSYTYPNGETWAVDDDRFIASYEDNAIRDDVSFVSICGVSNIYLVTKDALIQSGARLVGEGSDDTLLLPTESLKLVLDTSAYKLIQINVPSFVAEEANSFSFVTFDTTETRFLEPTTSGYPHNSIWVYTDGFSDASIVDMLALSEEFKTRITVVFPLFLKAIRFRNSFYVPLTVEQASNKTDSLFIVPHVKYSVNFDADNGQWDTPWFVNIRVYVVGEANVILGQVESDSTFVLSQLDVGTDLYLEIDPSDGVVRFSDKIMGFSQESTEAFQGIKQNLDISNLLENNGIGVARAVIVRVNVSFGVSGMDLETAVGGTTKWEIGQCYVGSSVTLEKDKLFLRTNRDNTLGVLPTTTPVGLAALIASENDTPIDTTSFGAVATIQRTLFSEVADSFDGSFNPHGKKSVSEILSNIAKQSLTALYPDRNGNLLAKWFMDIDEDTPTVYTFTDIVLKSLDTSEPQGGFVFTDFAFSIRKNQSKTVEQLYVNTDASLTEFPDEDYVEEYGDPVNSTNGWGIETIRTIPEYKAFRLRKVGLENPLLRFVVGTKWELTGTDIEANTHIRYATIKAVAIDPTCPATSGGVRVAFQYDAGQAPAPTPLFNVTNFQQRAQMPAWKYLVSGTFVTDYLSAKNVWEHAQNARLLVGNERPMSDSITKLEEPVWGSDQRALMQWILSSVIWATRRKTVLRFRVPMSATTNALWVMDYVAFQFGPYASVPLKGLIVNIVDLPAQAQFEFTVLVSLPDAALLLTLDERSAPNDLEIDERYAENETTLDERILV
jgi:hypothetical protein